VVSPPIAATNTRLIEDVNGVRFSVSRSAHEVFDVRNSDGTPAIGNAFEAVHQLGLALEANDRDATENALSGIAAALEHLNRQATFYGHTQNRVLNAIDLGKKALIARTRELSAAQETDMAEALVNLNMAKVHHEAALGAHARAPRSTLFDYLA
jgi:flagellin-like hook-associated protein FlgL